VSANVSVNTQPAERAFADLQKVLDGLMKNFGVNWEKASHDGMAAQERFWRYMGDKHKENEVALKRYSSEAIKGIEAERDASIAALKEKKMATEEFERAKTKIITDSARNSQRITEETARKEKQATGFGGLVRGARDALVNVGGPVGSTVAGIGTLLANPAVAIPAAIIGAAMEMLNTKAAFTSTGAQLAGAGLRLGAGAGAGLNFATNLFNGGSAFGPFGSLGQALSAEQQRAIIGQMAGSRTMIDQARGAGGFGAIRGNLGLFANVLPDASKEMELFTDATKSLGMSQKDITETFVSSRVNAERLKITQLDAIKTQMDMQKALRNITNDGAVAASVLSNITDYLDSIGASETEKQRIGAAVGQAGANLSLPQIAGMFAFTHGGKIPGPTELFGEGGMLGNKGGGVFGLMGSFLTQVGSQFKDPTQRMFAANQLQQQFLPGLRLQDIPHFFQLTQDMMGGKISGAEFGKQFQALEGKTPQVAMAEGINTLVQIVDPIKRLENVFSNFWTMVDDKINKIFESLGKANPLNVFKGIPKWVDKNIMHKPDGSHPTNGSSGSW
jgi:hypothetical protein